MHTVITDLARPDPELVSRFEGVPSTIASDVAEPGAMDAGIEPVYRDTELAGTALTVRAAPGDNLIIHKAITMAEPGDVLVVDGDGYVETAYVGELMCASCRVHGLAGMVIDGAIRDREEIAAMEFPVYARGVHPAGPSKREPGSINVPVSCGGVTVEPGDLVVGDDDGVSVVRAADAEAALERAREKREREAELRDRVETGEYLYGLLGCDDVFERLNVTEPDGSTR